MGLHSRPEDYDMNVAPRARGVVPMAAVIAAEVAVGELVSDEGASGEKDEALVRANTYKMGVLASRTAIRAGTDYNLDPPDARQAIAISDNLEELARIMEEANRAIGAPHRGV